MERTLAKFEAEDLLRELTMRGAFALVSWSSVDLIDEIELQAYNRGLVSRDDEALEARALAHFAPMKYRLESSMVEASYDLMRDAAESIVDDLREEGILRAEPQEDTKGGGHGRQEAHRSDRSQAQGAGGAAY